MPARALGSFRQDSSYAKRDPPLGPPATRLTDNGLVFTTRVRGGKNTFENEMSLLGIGQKNG